MTLDATKNDITVASRILFRHGIVDAFGHVSARHPDRSDHYLLSRSLAPASIEADDVMIFGPDDEATGDTRRPYLERFIHGAIYRARPDVNAIVHSHSPSVIPFGVVSGVRLRPVFHMCGFLGSGAALFEIRDARGAGTDMLIRDHGLGRALASALGEASVVLMRGHGATIVADSVRLAVYRAIYTELNAKLQCRAIAMGGEINFLNRAEAIAAAETNEGQLDRAWDLWVKQLDG